MGRDGAPRLKLTVITDDACGPRLCRGCGDPLMPSAKSTAVFCEDVCRSRHWRRMRRARARTEAVKAGVTASCPQCGAVWTVGVDRQVSAVYSRLPQTGLAHAARAVRRGVSLRVKVPVGCFGDAERETILRGLARVRASADWIENAVTRGEVDLDEQLQKLLKGSSE